MRVPLAEVGRQGRMDLRLIQQNGRTVIDHAYCEIPFKITRDLNSGGSIAHLMMMHCTAGLFGGDNLECSIRVERGARVIITQQSATKIHPSGGLPAIQRHHVFVEASAELQLYLEPVIPFRGSSLKQTMQIEFQPGARLVFWEGLMAGRVARGEYWQFQELSSETRLLCDGETLFLDRFLLRSGGESSAWSMGNCAYLGTGFYVGEDAPALAANLREELPEVGIDAITTGFALVRAVSAAGPHFHRCRSTFSQVAQLPG